MRPTSTRSRTFVKALVWETISFILTLGISYRVVGDIDSATRLTILLFVTKVIFLFAHERVWHRIPWGKT